MSNSSKKSILEMLPVITFIASYFIFHQFDWMEATQFIFATFVSLATYFFLVADFKVENKEQKIDYKRLNFIVGLLSLLAMLIFIHGFLHWQRMVSLTFRMTVLFLLLTIFMVAMFRAIRILTEYKQRVNQK